MTIRLAMRCAFVFGLLSLMTGASAAWALADFPVARPGISSQQAVRLADGYMRAYLHGDAEAAWGSQCRGLQQTLPYEWHRFVAEHRASSLYDDGLFVQWQRARTISDDGGITLAYQVSQMWDTEQVLELTYDITVDTAGCVSDMKVTAA